jgi:O-antigen ligase
MIGTNMKMIKKYSLHGYLGVIILLSPFLSPIRIDLGWLNATSVTFKTVWAMIGVLIGLTWWMHKQYKNKRIEIVKTNLYLPIFIFISWCYIGLFWVEDGYLAITMLAQFTTTALTFFLVVNVYKKYKDVNNLLIGLIASMFVISIIGLLQYYLIDNYLIQNIFAQFAAPSATFGNKNMASHFMVMTLPLAIVYVFSLNTKFRIVLMSIPVFIGFWYIMYISARQAYLAMFIEIAILILFFILDGFKNQKESYLKKCNHLTYKALVFLTVAALLILVSNFTNKGWNFDKYSKLDRVQKISIEGGSSRIPAWINTIELIKDNPIIGVGVGQWPQVYPLYYDRVMKDVIFNEKVRLGKLHNDYLEIFANFGLIGFLILLSFLFLVVKLIFEILMNSNHMYRIQTLGLSMGLVGFCVVAVFSFPVRVFLPIFFVSIYIAFIYLYSCAQGNIFSVKKINIKINPLTMAGYYFLPILTISLLIISSKWIMAEYHYFNAQSLLTRHQPEMSTSASIQAINNNHWPANYYFITGTGMLIIGVNSQNDKFVRKSILFFKKAIDISPYNTPALLQLTHAYRAINDKNSLDMERNILEFILSFDLKNVQALSFLVKNLTSSDRGSDAAIIYKRLKNSFEYFKNRDNFGPYHQLVGYVATSVADYKYARYIYEDAVDRFPTSENYILLATLEFDHLNNKELAIRLFKKALLLDPINIKNKFINSLILDYESNVK